MSALQFLRQNKLIARWVLVWFALSLTAAIAAPVVSPQNLTLVCTAAGQVKLVNADSQSTAVSQTGGAVASGLHQHLDCVLCMALDIPVASAARLPAALPSLGHLPSGHADIRVPRLFAHSVSARGPPSVPPILPV